MGGASREDQVRALAERALSVAAYRGSRAALEDAAKTGDLSGVEPSSKETFRRDFTEFLGDGAAARLHTTSGSTGQPAYVLYSEEEIAAITRRAVATMELAGVKPGDRVLNLFGYGTFIAGNLYDWGATALGAMVIPFGSPAMTPPRFSRQALEVLAPAVINGVPSYLTRFLDGLAADGAPGLDTVRTLQCAGEVLTPILRRRLAQVVPGATVFDQYGMTEFGPIAAECAAHEGMHLLEDGLLCEVVDAAGRGLDEGEGELVVSSLENRAMPLIRYRTGDRVALVPGNCACGSPGRRVRVLHRTGDLTKVRGVLCSKQEMIDAVRSVDGVDLFSVTLDTDAAGADRICVRFSSSGDPNRLLVEVTEVFKGRLRVKPDQVEHVHDLSVPRTVSGKPQFLEDRRVAELERRAS